MQLTGASIQILEVHNDTHAKVVYVVASYTQSSEKLLDVLGMMQIQLAGISVQFLEVGQR